MTVQATSSWLSYAHAADDLMQPVPEVILLLDADGRVLRTSQRHAGPRLTGLGFTVGEEPHRALHPRCKDDDCSFQQNWRRAWERHRNGLPVEWVTLLHEPEGVLKIRLQPVSYACGVLFEQCIEDYEGCSVAFLQDVTPHYQPQGEARVCRAANHVFGKPLGLACDGAGLPCDMVATIDQRLNATAGRLLVAQESERKRIAAELHDGLGQTLSLLSFEIEALEEDFPQPDPSGRLASLQRIREHVRHSLGELRRITRNLRPLALTNLGLYQALKTLCGDFRAACPDVTLECELSQDVRHIPEDIAVAVYRIAQEALNNVARHADATEASLRLSVDEGGVELVVKDDGVGVAVDVHSGPGIGLETMGERARILRGSFSIESSPGNGCSIRAQWSARAVRQCDSKPLSMA